MTRRQEIRRHERAVVLQQLGTPTAAAVQQDIAANQRRAAKLRRRALEGGESHARALGLVRKGPVAGGNGDPEPCPYCGIVGGHNGNCPVIS